MEKIARKFGFLLGLFTFFVSALVGLFSTESIDFVDYGLIFLKSFIGFSIFWIFGMMTCGIILKIILTHIAEMDIKNKELEEKN